MPKRNLMLPVKHFYWSFSLKPKAMSTKEEGVVRDKETALIRKLKNKPAESVDELKELEEELEAAERKLVEKLEYQIRIENEAKQKRLTDKSEGSSVGLHTGSVERTAVPGPSNQGISEDGLSLSRRQARSQNPTSDKHSQTLSEKENEANLSQIEGCFKEQTHLWVDPHLEDNERKALGHLSAEEHDEERFQADLIKAIQESLGATVQGISEDSLSPSGRQAHSQNPASDRHPQTLSENKHYEDNPSQIDEERFEANLTKAVQESLGMEDFPVEIIQSILSRLEEAHDVVSACVTCRAWLHALPTITSLHFICFNWVGYNSLPPHQLEMHIDQLVHQTTGLVSLSIIMHPNHAGFTPDSVTSWLSHTRETLRYLISCVWNTYIDIMQEWNYCMIKLHNVDITRSRLKAIFMSRWKDINSILKTT
ncbi:uncharacterized protein LOC131217469 [Magnolia sinica]|uniref:uncharacterized protein LOC131217469 n=1 Tax=Magnolia sinica TaxID=86752 RepID=UPI00265B228A|nr:uncharacterized protein LOC131217469 [Magnolia sinica]